MSMHRISTDVLEAAAAADAALVEEVKKDAKVLADEVLELLEAQKTADRAKAIRDKAAQEALTANREVLSQYREVLGGDAVATPPAADSTAVVEPGAPTAAAAPAATTTCCTPDPHAHASASATAINGGTVVLANRRTWSGVSWFFAILGALIGIVVASFTWHPLFSGIHGFGRGLLVVLWHIALTAFGFFGGGWLGWNIERRNSEA